VPHTEREIVPNDPVPRPAAQGLCLNYKNLFGNWFINSLFSGSDSTTASSVPTVPARRRVSPSDDRTHSDDDDDEPEFELKYGYTYRFYFVYKLLFQFSAAHVIKLFVPVSCCMLVVIVTMASVKYYGRDDGQYLAYTPFTQKTDDAGILFLQVCLNIYCLYCFLDTGQCGYRAGCCYCYDYRIDCVVR
jgi:hypothetical protein